MQIPWQGFYDETFARRLLVAPRPGELDFLLEQLSVQPGARLFDQCCGNGRVAIPLAERGFGVWGIDLCEAYIASAKALDGLHLEVGNAASYRTPEPLEGGFNLYSSFGYSIRDEENQALLECAAASLRSGAHFVLDTHNFSAILADFQPSMVSHFEDGMMLVRESQLDLTEGMLRQDWTYVAPDGQRKRVRGDCRIYLPHDLARMCRQAGLEPLRWFGGFAREPLERRSSRLILVCQRC